MAVSFKVPASPAKSVFTIDEFLGVDLTNSPANIQDNRSPNAPNMTRLVPGKVRKRMGYEKEVLFGTDVNVNWAIGTSCEERAFDIVANEWNELYKLETPSLSGTVTCYVEFDYKSEYGLYYWSESVTPDCPASPDEYSHASLSKTYTFDSPTTWGRSTVRSDYDQIIYIKNFSCMTAKNESYKWSPRPKVYVSNTANNEVFGFHKFDVSAGSNIMTDINRALGTATDKTATIATTSHTETDLYYLAEKVQDGRKIRIKVDYDYTITELGLGGVSLNIGGQHLLNFNLQVGHEEGTRYTGTFVTDPIEFAATIESRRQIIFLVSGSAVNITLSNLSVLYDMSDDYTWSAAPEDSLNYYYIEGLYNYGSTNYALYDTWSATQTSTQATTITHDVPVQSSGTLKGVSRLSFDLYTQYQTSNITRTDVCVVYYDAYSGAEKTLTIGTLPAVLNSEGSYSYLLSPPNTWQSPKGANWSDNNYITKIQIKGITTGNNTFYMQASKIKLVSALQKPNLNESIAAKLYHVGDKMFAYRKATQDYTQVATNMNPARSLSWQFGLKLFIIDGKNNYVYDYSNNVLNRVGQTNAYIPTVTISKGPTTGGTSFDALNLLQPGFIEMFINSSSTNKVFNLSFTKLDNTTCKAWVLDSNGVWQEKTEGTHFSVNRTTGVVTFVTSPGEPPVQGEDNVRIQAYKTIEGYAERIRRCTFGALFGVNGASDRLFLSGNPDMPNYDWYSGQNDPTYFPDTGYTNLGLESSAIVGYSIVNNYLATHKDDGEPSQSVFIREGDMIKKDVTTSVGTTVQVSEPAFKLINTLQGAPALTPYTFGYVETEPLFLTKSGIFALTTQDITGDKYGQSRSFYLNGELKNESNLKNAYACIYDNMYYLAVNNKVYLLDGLQATRSDRSDPYSTRQYVGYMWDNVPATIIYSDEGNLYFGTADGKICRFYSDVDSLDSYNDDGYPIDAWWETPDLDGKLFYKNKSFRYYAARLMAALATSVKMWTMKNGGWTLVKYDTATGRYFDFGNINFEKFSFSTDQTEKVVHTKIKVKKVDKARFKLENDALNEPFGIFNIALEYVESGNYKG